MVYQLLKISSWNEKGILLLIISYILRLKKNIHVFVNNKRYTVLLKIIFPDIIFEDVYSSSIFNININSNDKQGLCIKYSNDIINNINSDKFNIIPWFDNNNPMIGYLYTKNKKIELSIIKNKIKDLIAIRNHPNVYWDFRTENKIILEYKYNKYELNLISFLENKLNYFHDSYISSLESEIYKKNILLNTIKYNSNVALLNNYTPNLESDTILKKNMIISELTSENIKLADIIKSHVPSSISHIPPHTPPLTPPCDIVALETAKLAAEALATAAEARAAAAEAAQLAAEARAAAAEAAQLAAEARAAAAEAAQLAAAEAAQLAAAEAARLAAEAAQLAAEALVAAEARATAAEARATAAEALVTADPDAARAAQLVATELLKTQYAEHLQKLHNLTNSIIVELRRRGATLAETFKGLSDIPDVGIVQYVELIQKLIDENLIT